MIVRFRMDAALYEPAHYGPGQKGRPPKKGKRLPTLEQVAEDKHTRWKRLTVQEWYGEKKRQIEITSATAVWTHSGQPVVPIRWVIVRDPQKRFKTQSLLSTDLNLSAEQIVRWFPRRWQVEVTFHETRTHLGVETQRQWADLSILRITPALLSLFSIVTLLANLHARKDNLSVQQTAWYVKKLPTFSDALTTVKQNLYSYLYFQTSPVRREVRKSLAIRSPALPRPRPYRYSRTAHAFFQVSYG
jgi:DDE family transposase